MLKAGVRWFYFAMALLSLGLGILGAFLPILPTVPFILLAAWFAARSSPRLLAWLENHAHFGRYIRDWRNGGVVSRKAKWAATIMMSISAVIIVLTVANPWARFFSIGTMVVVGSWLWRRPESPPASAPGE
ncbi:YbaN family protein [Ramlibacter albus]|uniref:YbaN family protein n=1 Tax=Ramlibacter albus TaxID=2079448 RepID=A0A923M604_9BURK|nr:YbaN family protein [Ramlibacter albus]MBC5764446.1 YbaN family protein [Ramlibacter albus]